MILINKNSGKIVNNYKCLVFQTLLFLQRRCFVIWAAQLYNNNRYLLILVLNNHFLGVEFHDCTKSYNVNGRFIHHVEPGRGAFSRTY